MFPRRTSTPPDSRGSGTQAEVAEPSRPEPEQPSPRTTSTEPPRMRWRPTPRRLRQTSQRLRRTSGAASKRGRGPRVTRAAHVDVPDGDISETLAYYVEAAEAQEHAARRRSRRQSWLRPCKPAARSRQAVDERAARVQAIEDLRAVANRVSELVDPPGPATARGGESRTATRGNWKIRASPLAGRRSRQRERSWLELRAETERTAEQLATPARAGEKRPTRRQPSEHDEFLAAWQRLGGSRDRSWHSRSVQQRRATAPAVKAARPLAGGHRAGYGGQPRSARNSTTETGSRTSSASPRRPDESRHSRRRQLNSKPSRRLTTPLRTPAKPRRAEEVKA